MGDLESVKLTVDALMPLLPQWIGSAIVGSG
jgi:hypothetical protein